jgi:hypothetical protein
MLAVLSRETEVVGPVYAIWIGGGPELPPPLLLPPQAANTAAVPRETKRMTFFT